MLSGKYQFQKLTPTANTDIRVYEEAIDYVFKNSDIQNIAVSGAYSAGKSSLLESYKARHKEKKFLHLSLARFIPTEDDAVATDGESDVKESVLEGKILNQLLHQIPEKRIPQTNFKVKKEIGHKRIVFEVVLALIWLSSILRIAYSQQLKNFAQSLPENFVHSIFSGLMHPYGTIAAASICIIGVAYLLYLLIELQKNKSVFKKINVNGNEIEIFEKQEESYFDKYLNEVLYLFENSGADVIVFEDVDRFNSAQIFERLHEVNTLVNTRRKKKSESDGAAYEPLRFFYLLRDDMFVSKDRTKFFDFIIPVVPVLDSSNSYDKFIEIFKEAGCLNKFDSGFLQSLSLYVDDMRILKNICNEFMIYIQRINTIELDWNKMLALITYKNIFPRDFSELQLGKGFVHALFNKKRELVQETIKDLSVSRDSLKKKIALKKEENLISEQEFEDVRQVENDRYSQNWHRYTPEERDLHTKYQEDIPKRKETFQKLAQNTLDELNKELEEVEYKIQHIETAPLKSLITKENIEQVFSETPAYGISKVSKFPEIKSSDYFNLLKFLIRNGYIDETYFDYMSYFYEDSLSVSDKRFLRRITDQRGAEYAYSLKSPKKIAESSVLRKVEFEREEILNFDLLNYLLENLNNSRYEAFVNVLIAQLRDTKRFDFIVQFYSLDRARKQFVIKLNEQWGDFFCAALHESVFTAEQIKKYSIDTLYYSEPDVILSVNMDDCLCQYLSQTPEYIAIEQPDSKKLAKGFELLGVSIENLTDANVDPGLLDEIYRRNLYALNAENIVFVLRRQYGVQDDCSIWRQNLTTISSHKEEPLYRYVTENLAAYATVMLERFGDRICDTEAVALSFLNQDEVEEALKKQYISQMETRMTNLSEVSDSDLWTLLMERDRIELNADNLLDYGIKFGLDGALIKYINRLPENCDFSEISTKFKEGDRAKLYAAIVRNNDIQNQQYKMVLLGLGVVFKEYNANRISDEKVNILIDSGIIQMNDRSLTYMRNSYPQHLFDFIGRNLDAYIEMYSDSYAEPNDVVGMLTQNISDEKKIELLQLTNEPISVAENLYSDQVTTYILEHNYQSDDFDVLCQNYSQYGVQSRSGILRRAIENQSYIYSYSMSLDAPLLSELLSAEQVDRQYKVRFFINGIAKMDEESCKKHFEELGLSELCGIFDRHSGGRNYTITDETTEILNGLKQNGWIYDYHEDKRNPEKYVVIKNPPKQKQ